MGESYHMDVYSVLEAKLLQLTVGLIIEDTGLNEWVLKINLFPV